jgi:hypothetical protein
VHGAASNRRLAGVDTSGLHLDEHLAAGRNRAGYVAHLENVDVSVLVELNGFGHESYDRKVDTGIPSQEAVSRHP